MREETAVDAALAFAKADPTNSRERRLVWQDPVPTAAAGATMSGIEYMEAILAGEVPPPPIAVTMRMGPIEVGEGRAVFSGEPGEEHYNPIGVVPRGRRPLPRPQAGDQRGQPDCGRERQAARPRRRHLHDSRWLSLS